MKVLAVCALLAAIVLPSFALAQGVPAGPADGYDKGDRLAGPIGRIIGAAVVGIVGGLVGGVQGVLGIPQNNDADDRPPPRPPHRRRGQNDGR